MEARAPGLAAGPVHTEGGYVDPATAQKIAGDQAGRKTRAAGRRWGIWIDAPVVNYGWVTPESIDAAAPDVETTQHPGGAWWTARKSVADGKARALRRRLSCPEDQVRVLDLPS